MYPILGIASIWPEWYGKVSRLKQASRSRDGNRPPRVIGSMHGKVVAAVVRRSEEARSRRARHADAPSDRERGRRSRGRRRGRVAGRDQTADGGVGLRYGPDDSL